MTPLAAAAQRIDPAIAQFENRTRLRAFWDLELERTFHGLDIDLAAQSGLRERYFRTGLDIDSFTSPALIRTDPDDNIQVARLGTAGACLAFASEFDDFAIVDTFGNPDLELLMAADNALSMAFMAFCLVALAFAVAIVADALHLHVAEDSALHASNATATITSLTGLDRTTRLGFIATAMVADELLVYTDRLLDTLDSLQEFYLYRNAQVIALAPSRIGTRAAPETEDITDTAKKVTEIIHVHMDAAASIAKTAKATKATLTAETCPSLLKTRPEAVILRALVIIGENLISLVHFLELGLIAMRLIRVMLMRLLPESLLDLIGASVLFYS